MIKYLFIINRNGQVKLEKMYDRELISQKEQLINRMYHHCITTEDHTNPTLALQNHLCLYRRFSSIFLCIGFDAEESENELYAFAHFLISLFSDVFPQLNEIDFISRIDDAHYLLDCIISNGFIINTNRDLILSHCHDVFTTSDLFTFH